MSIIEHLFSGHSAGPSRLVVNSWEAKFKVLLDGQPLPYEATEIWVSLNRLLVPAKGGIGLGFSYPHTLKQGEVNTFSLIKSDFFAYARWREKYDEKPTGEAIITLKIELLPTGQERATVEGKLERCSVSKGDSVLEISGTYGFVATAQN